MNTQNLLNLDIGNNPPVKEFDIGSYRINLKKNYEELRLQLATSDVETAEISYDHDEPSLLLKSNLNKSDNAIWDVIYILSYLTGRVVTTPDLNHIFNTTHDGGHRIIKKYNFIEAANLAWENRANFKNDGEKWPLWLYFEFIQSPMLENKLIYAIIAFEIIIEKTLKRIKLDDGIDPEMEKLNELKKELIPIIESSKVSNPVKHSLLTAFGNWTGKKSVEGIRRYLFEREFINKIQVDDKVRERIQFINKLRNSIVHRAKFAESQSNFNAEQILNFAMHLIPGFIEDYLNCKFKIENFHKVQQKHEDLKGFLNKGKLWGVNWSIPA